MQVSLPSQAPNNDGIEDEDWDIINDEDVPQTRRGPTNSNEWLLSFKIRIGKLNRTINLPSKGWQREVAYREPTSAPERLLQEQSPLFRLPAELRIKIYEDLLILPGTTSLVHHAAKCQHTIPPSVLTILQTCARALAEAEEIFYTSNTFSIPNPTPFLHSLGPIRRNAITNWTIQCMGPMPPLKIMEGLKAAPGLRSLRVEIGYSIRWLSRDWMYMKPQLEAAVRGLGGLREFEMVLLPVKGEMGRDERERLGRFEELVRRFKVIVAAEH